MRILHISKFYPPEPGGIENFAADLAGAQVRQGHEVYVLCHQAGDSFGRPGTIEQREGVRVERVRTFGQFAYTPVCPEFFLRLRAVMACFRPEAIHAHVPNVSAFWLLFAKKTGPLVIHWHADVVASRIDRKMAFFYEIYRPWETRLLRAADQIICTSYAYLRHSVPLQKWRLKCRVVPLGLDASRLGPAAQRASVPEADGTGQAPLTTGAADSESRFTVLSVGRFTYYKGFEYLVRAAEKVPEADFLLVGDGPRKSFIEQLVARKGLEQRVRLLGRVDSHALCRLLAGCDLFCLPSIERTEAFGLVLLEAMVFGKPLVTTRIAGSGVTEVNLHGSTGLQVPPADACALAGAIDALRRNPEIRLRMGRQARRRFERNYEISAVCNSLKY